MCQCLDLTPMFFIQSKGAYEMASHAKMTKRQEELFRIFKMAITAEQEAQKMYKEAAEYCDDEDIRAMLQVFIAEEASHENQLMDMYKDFKMKFEIE
ncbi:MAG TPA: ferritin family protein [Geobacteraceae bacterium]|nr:ferritin family protein [Geobacteraceae bacterium]